MFPQNENKNKTKPKKMKFSMAHFAGRNKKTNKLPVIYSLSNRSYFEQIAINEKTAFVYIQAPLRCLFVTHAAATFSFLNYNNNNYDIRR